MVDFGETVNINVMKCAKNTEPNSFYTTNLNIIKRHVWGSSLCTFGILDKVSKLAIDELVKDFQNSRQLPMQLIQLYESIDRHLKRHNSLKMRIRYYVEHSTKLYLYIEKCLGKGMALEIFEKACHEVVRHKIPHHSSKFDAFRRLPIVFR